MNSAGIGGVNYNDLDSVTTYTYFGLHGSKNLLTQNLQRCTDAVLEKLQKESEGSINKKPNRILQFFGLAHTHSPEMLKLFECVKSAACTALIINRSISSPNPGKYLLELGKMIDESIEHIESKIPEIITYFYPSLLNTYFEEINILIHNHHFLRFKRNLLLLFLKMESQASDSCEYYIHNYAKSFYSNGKRGEVTKEVAAFLRTMGKTIKELENDRSEEGKRLRTYYADVFFNDMTCPATPKWLSNYDKVIYVLQKAKEDLLTTKEQDSFKRIILKRLINRYEDKLLKIQRNQKVSFPHFHHMIGTLSEQTRNYKNCKTEVKSLKTKIKHRLNKTKINNDTKNLILDLIKNNKTVDIKIKYKYPNQHYIEYYIENQNEKIILPNRLAKMIFQINDRLRTKIILQNELKKEHSKLTGILQQRAIKDLSKNTSSRPGVYVAMQGHTVFGEHGLAFTKSKIFKLTRKLITNFTASKDKHCCCVWFGAKKEIKVLKIDKNGQLKMRAHCYVARNPDNHLSKDYSMKDYDNYIKEVESDIIKRVGQNIQNLSIVCHDEFFLELNYLYESEGMLVPRQWNQY